MQREETWLVRAAVPLAAWGLTLFRDLWFVFSVGCEPQTTRVPSFVAAGGTAANLDAIDDRLSTGIRP